MSPEQEQEQLTNSTMLDARGKNRLFLKGQRYKYSVRTTSYRKYFVKVTAKTDVCYE